MLVSKVTSVGYGRLRRDLVQREIQFQNIDPRLSEKTELARLGMLANRLANSILAQATFFGDARHLKFRRFGRDVWIEPRTRGRQQIHWNPSSRILRLQSVRVALHARDQRLIGWPKIRSAGVVRIVSGSGTRRTRVEITGRGERLPNQSRSDNLAISRHQLAVRLPRKQNLRQSCNHQGKEQAKQYRRHTVMSTAVIRFFFMIASMPIVSTPTQLAR